MGCLGSLWVGRRVAFCLGKGERGGWGLGVVLDDGSSSLCWVDDLCVTLRTADFSGSNCSSSESLYMCFLRCVMDDRKFSLWFDVACLTTHCCFYLSLVLILVKPQIAFDEFFLLILQE